MSSPARPSLAEGVQVQARRTEARLELGVLRVLPMLWPLLDALDRRSLRACCQATRQRADWLVDALRLVADESAPFSDHLLLLDKLARSWSGVLARGARPRELQLNCPFLHADIDAFGMRLLSQMPPSLVDVRLGASTLSPDMVRAIAAAAPQLRVLHLSDIKFSSPVTHHPAGVSGVLQHAAPHLEELALPICRGPHDGQFACWGRYGVAWLPPLLRQCTRLASLTLCSELLRADAELAMLGQLPRLRSLCLRGVDGRALAALPRLSRLTRLSLRGCSNGAIPAVGQLRGLLRLELEDCALLPDRLQLLTGLATLTHLHLDTILLPPTASPEPDSGSAANPLGPDTLPLPPRLERLQLGGYSMHPNTLAALRFPPCLHELRMGQAFIQIGRGADVDEDGRVDPLVAESLLAACRQLVGRTQSASLWLSWMQPPASWLDRYGTLFAVLRPAAIRRLVLRYVSLQAADVAALAQHLPQLEVLDLICDAPALTWPLLRRLRRLRELRLHPGIGAMRPIWEEFGSQQALRAALLALCVEAPSLKRLVLAPASAAYDAPEVSVPAGQARVQCRAAVAWLAGVLPRLRADPPAVELLADLDVWSDDIEFGQQED